MSVCFYGPFLSDAQPVNCAYEVYQREILGNEDAPAAQVQRDGQLVDVTGTIEDLGTAELPVDIYTVDCEGATVAHSTTTELYHHWKVSLSGANAGEVLYVAGAYAGPIQPAGTCSTIALDPKPQCSGMYDWSVCEMSGSGSDTAPPGTDGTGCNVSGSASLLVGLALFGVSRRRRFTFRGK